MVNPSKQDLKNVFSKVSREVFVNIQENKKTFLFVYYVGHAVMDKDTYVTLSGDEGEFPVERMIRGLSSLRDTICFGIFSCGKLMMSSGDLSTADREADN